MLAAVALLASCHSTKNLQGKTTDTKVTAVTKKETDQARITYLRKVYDNATYSKNISSKVDVSINAMGHSMTLDGKLQMRKDEVIRITIVPFGLMEVGRLEFTPNYVLLLNRIDKEYVKATYNDLDFLKNNGLDFYTLQSLFWNEMFVPGKKSLADSDLSSFTTDMSQEQQRHVVNTVGKMIFDWTTSVANGQISRTDIIYGKGTSDASTMTFSYGNFTAMGSKRFPQNITLDFISKALGNGKMSLGVQMKKISNDSDWESLTTVSSKYEKVAPETVFRRLMSL